MKTKRRTFWSFFTRIGSGFLAFWLAVMAVFTVLLSQQRAKLMLAEMESKSDKLMGEDTDFLLDPSSYDTTDETELRRRLSKPVFMADSISMASGPRISPTIILSGRIRRDERIRSRIDTSFSPSALALRTSRRTKLSMPWI